MKQRIQKFYNRIPAFLKLFLIWRLGLLIISYIAYIKIPRFSNILFYDNLNLLSVELLFETSKEAIWLDNLFMKIHEQKLPVDKLVNVLIHKKIPVNLFKDDYNKVIEVYKKATIVDDISDEDFIIVIKKVLGDNQKAASDYKSGKTQVMKEVGKKIEFNQSVKLIKSSFQ